jgi:predicted nuclease of predicted toxin-antitoxin system
MKFLADVNIDRNIVARLREAGHEVEWLAESTTDRRLTDPSLMQRAYDQGQVILTNDTGFSRHVFHERLPTHGVILLRVANKRTRLSKTRRIERSLEAIEACQGSCVGQFSTVYPDRIEQTLLPT